MISDVTNIIKSIREHFCNNAKEYVFRTPSYSPDLTVPPSHYKFQRLASELCALGFARCIAPVERKFTFELFRAN